VGPEQLLVDGVVDSCRQVGIACFGPSSKAAEIEASKAFSKEFMKRHGIPTPRFKIFSDYETALQHVQQIDYPVVLKASGLASGKGVLVPETQEETIEGLKTLLLQKPFGSSCDQIIVEERLQGPELSVLAFTDGYTVAPMPGAQDHKRIGDNDQGANTGGMGAYAPTPLMTEKLLLEIKNKILQPTVDGLRKEGRPYVGVLFAGLMLTSNGPQTLEFNCRMGDPETQVVLPLLDTDLLDILEACVERCLDSVYIKWKLNSSAVTVVMASKGYPGTYERGKEILGLENQYPNITVFHAGTSMTHGKIVTSGGRVLAVTAVTSDITSAINSVYEAVQNINFEGAYYRKDIAKRALHMNEPSLTYKDAGVDIDSGDNLVEMIKSYTKSTARPAIWIAL